jgi:hypothetical protein
MALTQEQKDIIKLMVKVGIVGTAVSIPVALWAIPKWRENTIIPAIILTAIGLGVKEYMLHGAVSHDPLHSELAGAPVRLNMGCAC